MTAGVGGVDLQRQRGHAQELVDEAAHDRALVDLGQAGVDVQDLGARALLGDGLGDHVVVVAAAQRLLHLLLARGVDALADDAHLARSERRHALWAADGEAVGQGAADGGATGEQRALGGDVPRGRTAAAAEDGDARIQHGDDRGRKLVGAYVIDRDAVLDMRQPGVCLHHERAAGPVGHARHERGHLRGAERAVDAHRRGAERGQREGGDLRRGAQEGASVLLEGHRDEGGEARVLTRGEQGRLGLREVRHGLYDKEVRPGRLCGTHLPGEELVGVVEGERAHGRKELTRRPQVSRHVAGARGAGAGHGRRKDLLHRGGVTELGRVGAEGVGGHHVGTGRDVGGVHVRHHLRVREAQELGQLPGGEPARLELRAHGAVDEQKRVAVEGGGKQVLLGGWHAGSFHVAALHASSPLGAPHRRTLCIKRPRVRHNGPVGA